MKKIGVSLALGVLSLTLSAPAMAQDIELGEIEGEVAIDDAETDGAMDEGDERVRRERAMDVRFFRET